MGGRSEVGQPAIGSAGAKRVGDEAGRQIRRLELRRDGEPLRHK